MSDKLRSGDDNYWRYDHILETCNDEDEKRAFCDRLTSRYVSDPESEAIVNDLRNKYGVR